MSKMIDGSLYIHLGRITQKEVKKLSKNFSKYEGIIFDLRNYPLHVNSSDITKYLYPDQKEFIKVLSPTEVPGVGDYDTKASLSFFKDPFKQGKPNKDYYKGKVVLLVDNQTVSKAEYVGLAIQNSPNCITIGEKTNGAVMNMIEVPLTDGDKVNYTGMTAFYPNGQVVQREGLKIDYVVKQSASHPGVDYQLQKALDLINEN